MNRRRFLASGVAVSGGFLGDRTLRAARRHLGLWRAPAPPRAAPVDRDPDRSARVAAVDASGVTVTVTEIDSSTPFRLLVVRRRYPTGAVAARATSDVVDANGDATPTTVDVDVPAGGRDSELGGDREPWFYEVYARPGSGRESRGYLCESAPYARTPSGDVTRAQRVADPDPSLERDAFARRREGNDHVLTYRWQDATGDAWTVDYRVRRSTHEAAVAADRGYVETYEESLSSPIAADLGSRLEDAARPIGADAARPSGDDDDARSEPGTASNAETGLASLSPGRRFESLVAFVQELAYAYDAETLAAYDYHRTVEETLVAGIADCKDRTYLLAGLLAHAFDCETALLFQSGHVLLGVRPRDVPDLARDPESVTIGGEAWVPIEPSLEVPVGVYPANPFLAVYGSGEWRHHDAAAIARGTDRVANSLYDYLV